MLVLFQGDSITDCHRRREDEASMGNGYASIIEERLSTPKITLLNKGESGDTTGTLLKRWNRDCIRMRPDILSLLIGVNDTLHPSRWGKTADLEGFRNNCETLLGDVKRHLPETKVVVMEPFLLPILFGQQRTLTEEQVKNPAVQRTLKRQEKMLPDIVAMRETLREITGRLGFDLIPLGKVLEDACKEYPPIHWASDGIHPTAAGHRLIAETWLCHTGKWLEG